ncbi:MAG: GpE family phage tail protein [Oceanospirillaceae bacterium]|nr:GpE family phage tail protein [Oceanospirillaceae bacterium]
MADIAMVLHFSIAEMDAMSLADLSRWREQARQRHNPE